MPKKPPEPATCCEPPDLPEVPAGLDVAARLFKALADETRLKLLHLVRHEEVCVCDLVAAMGMPQGTLSHHLLLLHQAGLVSVRKQGRWNYYRATPMASEPLRVFADAGRRPSLAGA